MLDVRGRGEISKNVFGITYSLGGSLVVKNPHANAGDARDMGSIPGPGRSPGGRNGNPPQYS